MRETPPYGIKQIVNWAEKSLEPKEYWGDRYLDVLHERVDGFLSGVICGMVLFGFIVLVWVVLIGVL